MFQHLFVPTLVLASLPNVAGDAMVEGVGLVPIESVYLPRVVACENGAAEPGALVAQAIAARSYLYYELTRKGSIGDGTEAQVYTCSTEPESQHYEAVDASRHTVISYQDGLVAAFYVAGARPSAASCIASDDDPDPSNTERFVTYNMNLRGAEVFQSPLGLVDPANLANRGCLSQNGSRCLARAERSPEEILHFYYGEDIELVTLEADPGSEVEGTAGGCRCVSRLEGVRKRDLVLLLAALCPAFFFRRRSPKPQLDQSKSS